LLVCGYWKWVTKALGKCVELNVSLHVPKSFG
jgi:hypothetical protein